MPRDGVRRPERLAKIAGEVEPQFVSHIETRIGRNGQRCLRVTFVGIRTERCRNHVTQRGGSENQRIEPTHHAAPWNEVEFSSAAWTYFGGHEATLNQKPNQNDRVTEAQHNAGTLGAVPTEGDESSRPTDVPLFDAPDSSDLHHTQPQWRSSDVIDTVAWREQAERWQDPVAVGEVRDPTTQILIDPTGQLAWTDIRNVASNLEPHDEAHLATRVYHRAQLRRVALILVAFTILQALGRVLAAMHVPGGRSASITNLANPFTRAGRGRDILQSWVDWDRSPDAVRPYRIAIIAGAWLIVSTFVVVPAVARLLHSWARRRHDALRDNPTASRPARRVGRLCRLAAAMCFAYAIANIAENLAAGWAIARHGGPRWLLSALAVASGAKWVFLALVIIAPIGSYLWNWPTTASTVQSGWATVMRLRPQLVGVAVAMFTLVLLPSSVRPQLDDQLRAWWDHPGHALAAVVGVFLLSMLVWITGSTTLARADRLARDGHAVSSRLGARRVFGALVAAAAMVGLGIVASRANDISSGALPFVIAVVLVAWIVLSLPVWVSPTMRRFIVERREPRSRWLVLHVLAFAPFLAFTLAVVRAVTLAPTARAIGSASGLLLVSAGIASRMFRSAQPHRAPDSSWVKPIVAFMLTAFAGLTLVWAGREPIAAGRRIGSIGLVMAFSAVLIFALWIVSSLASRPPTGALAFVRIERFPTLSVVAILLIGANLATTTPGFHRVRIVGPSSSQSSPRPEATLEEAFRSFTSVPSGSNRSWRPLVLVATSGGGARSAYWTMLTWSCLFGGMTADAKRPACEQAASDQRSVFAASGISGGAVALAMEQAAPGALDPEKIFDNTFVESVVANLVSVDAPNALVQSPVFRDRATVLEQSWEDAIPELATRTLFEPRSATWSPLMMFDSASSEDGCRFIASPLNFGSGGASSAGSPAPADSVGRTCGSLYANELPATGATPAQRDQVARVPLAATRDARSALCDDQDLRLSTAALLAARFPFVSPTGALPVCAGGGGRRGFTYLVDGGLVESSGASPVVGMLRELLPRIQQYNRSRPSECVQPMVMQIDNDYTSLRATDPPSRPVELLAPIAGLGKSGERANAARQQLAELGSQLGDLAGCDAAPNLPTYLHVRPRAHPGTNAPLGWSLSSEARRDLRTSFETADNQCALLVARAWITPASNGTTCITGTVATPDGNAAVNQEVCLATSGACPTATIKVRTDPFGGFHLLTNSSDVASQAAYSNGSAVPISSGIRVDGALVRNLRLAVPAVATTSVSGGRPHRAATLWALGAFLLLGALTVAFSSRRADHDDDEKGTLPL
jgi:hypothetical protein